MVYKIFLILAMGYEKGEEFQIFNSITVILNSSPYNRKERQIGTYLLFSIESSIFQACITTRSVSIFCWSKDLDCNLFMNHNFKCGVRIHQYTKTKNCDCYLTRLKILWSEIDSECQYRAVMKLFKNVNQNKIEKWSYAMSVALDLLELISDTWSEQLNFELRLCWRDSLSNSAATYIEHPNK